MKLEITKNELEFDEEIKRKTNYIKSSSFCYYEGKYNY